MSDIELRVYTSNLLGKDDTLVLHGGGNTSVKIGDTLYVKGSGWDLATIKKEGFTPVSIKKLLDLLEFESLSDSDMVKLQKEAMTDKSFPNPSIEAILHAFVPFKFVDHTHADSVVTISNSINGKKIIDELYKDYLIVPYVMPGFILAKKVYELSKSIDFKDIKGIILHNHGIFTFDDDGKKSYEKMIESVQKATDFLEENAKLDLQGIEKKDFNIQNLAKKISDIKGYDVVYKVNDSKLALNYSKLPKDRLTRGVLTPEHIIRTKREPLVIKNGDDLDKNIDEFIKNYKDYFNRFAKDEVMLNPAPNYAVIEDFGIVSFGKNEKEVSIINDITSHTAKAVMQADMLGGYESISLKDSFDMEYWELEQAKLKG